MSSTPDEAHERSGPYCSATGCVGLAVGSLMLAYAKPRIMYLCSDHLKPLRAHVLKLLRPETAWLELTDAQLTT